MLSLSRRHRMAVNAKICGLTDAHTLDAALRGGAGFVGLVFAPDSPRAIAPEAAAALAARTQGRARTVGLFVEADAEAIAHAHRTVGLDVAQLHGVGDAHFAARLRERLNIEVWHALPVRTRADLDQVRHWVGAVDRILFDAKPPPGAPAGGNGIRFDWNVLHGWRAPLPWMLSGGLDADNVAEAVIATSATHVDVSSGVESARGVKDVDKIVRFLQAVGT